MSRYVKIFSSHLILLVTCQFYDCINKVEDIIPIAGSRTMEPIIKNTAAAFTKNQNMNVGITANGSMEGFDFLIRGKSEIADSSVRMPYDRLLEARKRGIAIKEFLIAYDVIVPIVHPANSLDNLFLGQYADIYTGLLRDWKDVGGSPGKISVVDRDESSGTKLILQNRFFESRNVLEGKIIQHSNSDVVLYVAKNKDSIGYISMSSYIKKVKPVMINGFRATPENVVKGYYPLYRELYLYVNERSYKGVIKAYIDFILSKKGQDIIQTGGFIPVALMKKIVK